ncbi:MAG: adenylate/guanylate cyclase domain-containing protein [Vicinamibacterales bacterium]
MLRKVAAGLLLGLCAAAFVLLPGWIGLLDLPELKTYDWRVRRVARADSVHRDIVLVEINDESIRAVAKVGGRWPWPRVVLADAIDFLKRGSPKAIAVDFHIAEPDMSEGVPYGGDTWSGAESDAALVESVRNTPRIIMLADAVHLGVVGGSADREGAWTSPPYRLGPAIEERPQLVPPIPGLAQAAALGHNLLHPDRDGPARRMAPFIRIGDRYVPSLGVAAALVAADVKPEEVVLEGRTIRVRDRVIPLVAERVPNWNDASESHDQLTMLINYRAPAIVNGARPYTSYEIRDLLVSQEQLNAGMAPVLDPAVFKDKIVFVGLTASGLLDVFTTPFGEGVMPGIQLHASMADGILSDRFIRPAPDAARIAGTLAAGLVVALMATTLPYAAAAAGAVVVTGGWLWLCFLVFRDGIWLNMSQPIIAGAVALFAGTAYQYFVEGAEKRAVKKLFGRYVSKDVYEQLVANPELAQLGGKRREMSVLFSDIRGFTTVTEQGDPEELVLMLNEYFSRMVAIVFRQQGTVDKFVGDMVMALFGAPLDDPAHAEHAVATAVDMVRELGELNRKWAAEGRTQLDIGIGVNSGGMIAGNIGSSSIMSYTVIGDNVNLGARLESLNKDYRTRIIISDATRSLLQGQYEIRPLGDVVVKGKTRPVAIFEVVVPSPLQAAHEEAQS